MRVFIFATGVIAIACGYYFNQDLSQVSNTQFAIMMIISGPFGFAIPLKMYPIFLFGYLISFLPLLLLKKLKMSRVLTLIIFLTSTIIWLVLGLMSLISIR